MIEPYSAQDTAATGIAARVCAALIMLKSGNEFELIRAIRLLEKLRDILPPPSKEEVRRADRIVRRAK